MQKTVGDVLEALCEEKGLWHYEAAKMLNVSTSTFSRYIRGHTPMPDDILAEAIRRFQFPELGYIRCQSCPVCQAIGDVGCQENCIKEKSPLQKGP